MISISATIKIAEYESISILVQSEKDSENLTLSLRKCILLVGMNHPTIEYFLVSNNKPDDPHTKLVLFKLNELRNEFKDDPEIEIELKRLTELKNKHFSTVEK